MACYSEEQTAGLNLAFPKTKEERFGTSPTLLSRSIYLWHIHPFINESPRNSHRIPRKPWTRPLGGMEPSLSWARLYPLVSSLPFAGHTNSSVTRRCAAFFHAEETEPGRLLLNETCLSLDLSSWALPLRTSRTSISNTIYNMILEG